MSNKKQTLWTKNFTCITSATVLSIIGGEVMNLPLSLMVFENTRSTMLSAIVLICGFLPGVLLSIFVAPFIDKGKKKRWIVGLDALMLMGYLFMGFWVLGHEFQYLLYVALSLTMGTISVFYRLAYGAWYPDLIPVGFEQKGYAISGTIYPLITIVMSPVATFLYEKVSMSNLFFIVAVISGISILIESQIQEDTQKYSEEKDSCQEEKGENYSFQQYKEDIKEGFSYLKNEKGIRNIYSYMAIMSGTSEGTAIAIQAFYQTSPVLTVTMLGFLKSAEMVGRVLSGIFQYRFDIPARKRYGITKFVYITYQIADMILLFTPYSCMLVNRFICGGLGTTSATVRETAVQSYLPGNIRARVNALFNAIFSFGSIFFQFFAGILGEVMPYRAVILIMGFISLAAVWGLIIKPDDVNRKVYESVRLA